MARLKDKNLFAFLKDRKIFVNAGDRTLREFMTRQEQKSENILRAKKGLKKATKK